MASFAAYESMYIEATKLALILDKTEPLEEIANTHISGEKWLQDMAYQLTESAIKNRCHKVYDFLTVNMTDHILYKTLLPDQDGNNLLHIAGKLTERNYETPDLQMKMEIEWFKKVEKFVLPQLREASNRKEETPIMVFRREHMALRKEGEKSMRSLANTLMTVSAILLFSVALTFFGGYERNRGRPTFVSTKTHQLLAPIMLFTMSSSLVLFLSIVTSNFNYEDFLYKLHLKLRCGLIMLVLSIVLMVTYTLSLFWLNSTRGLCY